jgi:hypothetical protein
MPDFLTFQLGRVESISLEKGLISVVILVLSFTNQLFFSFTIFDKMAP